MEKYAIIQCVDGNFTVVSEWNDSEKAKKAYHTLCAALWNDKSFAKGYAAILDTQLDIYQGYKELIQHEVQATPAEPVEE